MLGRWRQALARLLPRWGTGTPGAAAADVPDALWQTMLGQLGFLTRLSDPQRQRLRQLSAAFLQRKTFAGAAGLVVSDDMALAVAAQACLPLLELTASQTPAQALRWYDDFVGIVLYPGEVRARRQRLDGSGVLHEWEEELAGEAMDGGPVVLAWSEVARAGETAAWGYNLVIHEFAHKIDARDGVADGCPPLPPGVLGASNAREARQRWLTRITALYDAFAESVTSAERFSGLVEPPWLDGYAATSVVEFFAVATEAYCVAPGDLRGHHAHLFELMEAFYGLWQTAGEPPASAGGFTPCQTACPRA